MDHFLYLPIIGLIGLAVAALGDLEARFPARQRYVIGGATIVVALMAIESNAIANLFVDQGTLWTYTLQRDPNSWIAHNNIGVDLMNQQRYAEAIPHFREVLRLHPGRSDDGYNLAMAYEKLGETAGSRDEAITDYEQAIAVVPDFAQIRYNLGSLLLESGNLPTAIEQLQAAVKLAPQMAPAHENLGSALAQSGRVDDAIGQFEAAVKINGSYLIARNNLAVALAQTGRTSDAIDQFKQVLQIDPANIAAQAGLARLQHIATPQAAPAKK
jgi:tetratricopeptide (TPR) repeat protein